MSQKANTTRVLFDKPICVEIMAPVPAGRRQHYDWKEINTHVEICKSQDFDDRAVVCLDTGHRHTLMQPYNWGVVMDLCRSPTYNGDPYRPIRVKWVRDAKITTHWPEELIVIHRPITLWEVDMILEKSA